MWIIVLTVIVAVVIGVSLAMIRSRRGALTEASSFLREKRFGDRWDPRS